MWVCLCVYVRVGVGVDENSSYFDAVNNCDNFHFYCPFCFLRFLKILFCVFLLFVLSRFPLQLFFLNLVCDSWTFVDARGLYGNSSRFGHSAVVDPSGMMAVFGGFIGRAHHDLLLFDSGVL